MATVQHSLEAVVAGILAVLLLKLLIGLVEALAASDGAGQGQVTERDEANDGSEQSSGDLHGQ